jgi:hypothetical protein
MAQPSSLDPFTLWRDLVSQMEKGANDLADPGMKSDEFAKVANKVLGATVAGKAIKREMLNRYFGTLNLPTRTDVEALADRLQAIEDRLIGMQTTLDRLAGATPRADAGTSVAAPARTRKPPQAVQPVQPVQQPATPAAPAARGAAARKSRKARP